MIDNLTRTEAQQRAAAVSNVAYDVHLTLTAVMTDTTFKSVTTVTFDYAEPGGNSFIDLNAPSVESIILNGKDIPTTAFQNARIALSDLAAHNTLTVVANCAYQHTGVGLHRIADPVDQAVYMYTHFEPFDAHKVLTCFDQPDIKAPWTLHVTAPNAWEIVSNSKVEKVEQLSDNRSTTHFEATPRISTYLYALITGPYHVVRDTHNDIPLGVYCRKSLGDYLDPEEIFTITKDGLDFFTARYDYPYPFSKYDQLFVPEFNVGAMENPGCITINDRYVFRSKVTDTQRAQRATTILHEMAHMWFGDLVTMQWWDDLWLNESFATYMATLAMDKVTRFTDAWVDFTAVTKAWAAQQDQLPSTHPIVADMPDTESVRLNFDGITYAKGASVLRQLVAWVGDEPFMEGLRHYFKEFEWRNATLADFLTHLEQSSGRELTAWSKEWLETSGIATLSAKVSSENGRITACTVEQTALPTYPTLRSHRIGVGLYSLHEDVLRQDRYVECDIAGATTVVPELVGAAMPDLLLINDRDLTFAKVSLDSHSLHTIVDHLDKLADPLARAVCWLAAWNMTRDAEMTTTQYVNLITKHAYIEKDVATLERLLARAVMFTARYAHPRHRLSLEQQIADSARTALHNAAPGSDLQLTWLHCFIAVARDTAAHDDLTYLRGLLDGQITLPGLMVDPDVRWKIVARLAALGAIDETIIAAEETLDPTDLGKRRAATARTLLPTAAAKAAAWERLMHEERLPLATLEAITAGFHHPDQDELILPYLPQFAAALPSIWLTRTADEATSLTEGLFPAYLTDAVVIETAEKLLTGNELPGPARRILTECTDQTRRANRARDMDGAAGKTAVPA